MISYLPKHILTFVPLSVLLIIPSLILAVRERYTLFAWLAVFTCAVTLVFHAIVGIITIVSYYRHPEQWAAMTDYSGNENAPYTSSNPSDLELSSPTSPTASSPSTHPTIRYYTSGGILFQCILLVFWITSWVLCISDTIRGPGRSEDTMAVNAPWSYSVQIAGIFFFMFECITLGILVVKCVMVKKRLNAKRALIAEERKFNLPRSKSIRRTPPPVPAAWSKEKDVPLPAVPELTVPANSHFLMETAVGNGAKDRKMKVSSSAFQVSESKYASLGNIQTAHSPNQPESMDPSAMGGEGKGKSDIDTPAAAVSSAE